jgi:hypothetical protein
MEDLDMDRVSPCSSTLNFHCERRVIDTVHRREKKKSAAADSSIVWQQRGGVDWCDPFRPPFVGSSSWRRTFSPIPPPARPPFLFPQHLLKARTTVLQRPAITLGARQSLVAKPLLESAREGANPKTTTITARYRMEQGTIGWLRGTT